ncbi:type II toxin-antitoxin system VapB family antitoxin [Demequina mangrovi]|uniref:Antitoxin VapB n=1 Tax=Demequina mangrovi TaxID=1043493 RepID=A0A1H6ZQ87_9MICO|nr:type II toxin-antitoxin system VapB family antitoxin [Demequina mangrovi]SEJ51872.1 antitoxin VapB [Demequina mangrovi]
MSLNIKNARTVALVRELAERTGSSQTSAIEEAVRMQLKRLDAQHGHPEADARLARARVIVAEIQADLGEDDRAAIVAAQRDLYDESGLPR